MEITMGGHEDILTPEALDFVADLERDFWAGRRQLLDDRVERQQISRSWFWPRLLASAPGDWVIDPVPADLSERKVEITGPVDRKMMINALNSGASVFMADFEDATTPTWANLVEGQANLVDAYRRNASLETPDKSYRLNETSPA